ncbi:hypothetical protein PDESU_01480 [Pontiella desulfatans]|uniref:Uncharacterized protein n=1 Tax=Pontiella desulfatans TaxID=2750659 RepID=A0A6C2U0K7_PONDE|nr:hypothetical protein [Pontiella desulfatans]VGO12926.1 hypothetical protein PDESU_01480 [Pontiella desulfatans]
MKTTETKHRDENGSTWKEATAKGALVWGSVYSTASSGAAFLLAPVMTGSSPAFGDIFMDSLIIFPTAGAAKGLLMWRMNKASNDGESDALAKYTSKGRKTHKHPIRLKKAA